MEFKKIIVVLIAFFELNFGVQGSDPNDFPDNICEGKNSEHLAHPDSSLCTYFIYCYFEIPILFYCEYPTEVFHNGNCVAGSFQFCSSKFDFF
jgi:hypothetical protein